MSTLDTQRYGTTAEHSTYTGPLAEVTVDTDKDTAVVHDGTTPGGHPLAKESDVDAINQSLATKLSSETVTSLILQSNILKYTDENGAQHDIPLSPYIDDTNLSRLVSGSVDTAGVATFLRDDNTSFTINMSSFLDNTKLTAGEIVVLGFAKDDLSNVSSIPASVATQLKGYTGSRGATGATGTAGATGYTGSRGAQGIQGVQGVDSVSSVVTYLSKSGHQLQAMLVDGELYTTSGASGYYCFTSGLHKNAPYSYGTLNNFNHVNIPSASPIKKVGGFMHSYAYALLENGNLYTWGHNLCGQCGLGHINGVTHPILAATNVLDAYDNPSQGGYTVDNNRLFILKSNGLYAAGFNSSGQCGVGNTTSNITSFTKCTGLTNTSSSSIKKVYGIGTTYGSTWVLTSNNKLWVTGKNNTGNHGDGTTIDKSTFTDVTSHWVTAGKTLSDIKVTGGDSYIDTNNVDQGSQGIMVLLLSYTDGTSEVKTAGYNVWNSLGDGTATQRTTAISPIGLPKDGSIVDISSFGGAPLTVHALLSNGTVYGWGHNGGSCVGDGGPTHVSIPVVITTGVTKLFSDGITSLIFSYMSQNFMQKADGLYMNGQNDPGFYAGMGPDIVTDVLTPTKVLLPDNDNQVVDMGHFTTRTNGRILLALTTKGNVYTWGYNGNYGISPDTTNHVPIPALITLPRRKS